MTIDIYFDAGLQGWIKKTARQEYWRIANWHDWFSVDDLVQEGYICYLRCRNRYVLQDPDPGTESKSHPSLYRNSVPTVDQRKHFMRLVKSTFWNHLMTLSSDSMKLREEIVESIDNGNDISLFESLLPPQEEEATVVTALLNAPAEITDAINKLVGDGIDGGKYLRSRIVERGDARLIRGRRALRETTPERLQRVFGDAELANKTLAYLRS